jgi:hypothetical protein
MTRKQLESKVRNLLVQQDITILEKLEKVIHSGAIELSDYQNDFLLAKIFMTAVDKFMVSQWEPHHKDDLKTVENLGCFI